MVPIVGGTIRIFIDFNRLHDIIDCIRPATPEARFLFRESRFSMKNSTVSRVFSGVFPWIAGACLWLFFFLPNAVAFNELESWEEPASPSPSPQPKPVKTEDVEKSEDTEKAQDAQKKNDSKQNEQEKRDSGGKTYRIGRFGLSPKLGYSWMQKMKSSADLDVPTRNAFKLMLDLSFGGDGFGFRFSPVFTYQTANTRKCPETSALIGLITSTTCDEDDEVPIHYRFKTFGAYFGSMYRFQIGNVHPSIGLGTQASYYWDDNIEHGFELFGRIPLEVIWYVTEHFAVVAEFAFLYGATGWQGSQSLSKKLDLNLDFNVGYGFGLDALIGVYFP